MTDLVTPKPGETPPADPPKTEPPKVEPPKVADPPKVDPPKPPDAPAGPRELSGDDDEPKAGERVVLSSEAFRKRLERSNKAQLRAEFGTDDPKVLKEKLTKLETYEAAEEERRKAALTKEQAQEERATKAEERAAAAEARVAEIEESSVVREADNELREVLKDVVKPKYWKHVRVDLAEHLDAEYGEKLDAMTDAQRETAVKDWAKKYVEENPEYATAPPVAKKEDPPPPPAAPQKVPLTNGIGNRGRPAPVTTKFEGKTLKPGQPNSMTAAEVAEWKRLPGNAY
jgi:hypothetical protein